MPTNYEIAEVLRKDNSNYPDIRCEHCNKGMHWPDYWESSEGTAYFDECPHCGKILKIKWETSVRFTIEKPEE